MTIGHVVVAIPARDEARLLPGCLRAVAEAARVVRESGPVTVEVVVALDGCVDASREIAVGCGVSVVELPPVGVGAARDAAIRAGLARSRADLDAVWVANTDADTRVSPTWLALQLCWGEAGYDIVVGTVEPVGVTDPALLKAWHDRHELAEGHAYVHGANLGLRASTYVRLGGFPATHLHEDVRLVTHARHAGVPVLATDTTRVQTSGRSVGRLRGGFADYLRAVRADEHPVAG